MNTRIIQASHIGTGSTLLVNILYGLMDPHRPVTQGKIHNMHRDKFFTENLIVKTNNMNIDKWIKRTSRIFQRAEYDLYFICTERRNKNRTIDNKYHSYENVLCIQYEDILETCSLPLEDIITNIQQKLLIFLPDIHSSDIIKNKEMALSRIINMDDV